MNIKFIKQSIGLDISDYSIEIVLLSKDEKKIKVLGSMRTILSPGIVVNGRIKDKEKLKIAIKKVLSAIEPFKKESINYFVSFPENLIYPHIFKTSVPEKNISSTVTKELSLTMPLPIADIFYDYRIIEKRDNSLIVLAIATSQIIINERQNFFKEINLPITIYDPEPLALFRGIFSSLPPKPICLLDFGARSISLSIFNRKGLIYSFTLKRGGEYLTREIAKNLKINHEEAEKQKKENGLLNKETNKIREIIEPYFLNLIKEIKNNLNYFSKKYQPVEEIIILGGGSLLPGFIDYLRNNLSIPIRMAQPWLNNNQIDFFHIGALGLACRGLDNSWEKTDPCFSFANPIVEKKPINKIKFILLLDRSRYFINKIKNISFKKKIAFVGVFLIIIFFTGSIIYYHYFTKAKIITIKKIEKKKESSTNKIYPPLIKKVDKNKIENNNPSIINNFVQVKKIPQSLNIRSGPGINYKVIGKLPPLSKLPLLDENNGWYKIKTASKKEGWIFSRFTAKINNN